MLEVVHGKAKSPGSISALIQVLRAGDVEGTLYIGYPVLSTVDENIVLEALLVSATKGVVAFDIPTEIPAAATDAQAWKATADRQDKYYFALKTHFARFPALRRGRDLAVPLEIIAFFPQEIAAPADFSGRSASPTTLVDQIAHGDAIPEPTLKALNAALQCITTIKPAKRRLSVTRDTSRGGILRLIEKEIANLDQWQKKAALECPEGPQRIRGLAGSGKTITLALKAAYLHARYPQWKIAVTFFSRSLYQQFNELISRFFKEHCADDPNFSNLQILHAWGGPSKAGLYATFASAMGHPVRDFVYAKSVFGRDQAFAGVCDELLKQFAIRQVAPIYDAILIDEAQDMPASFFRLIYEFTKPPKRIVWAYDELQNLTDRAGMPPVNDLFGKNADNSPRVSLDETEGEPKRDVILPVCYRNTPWALTVAHALGFGIYRKKELVQHFDDVELWTQIGYGVMDGALEEGSNVRLKRRTDATPPFFANLLTPADAVQIVESQNEQQQAEAIADSIAVNLTTDELEHDDILIILPYPLTARRLAIPITSALARRSIPSHIVGATTSQDHVFQPNSIAISHIFRAKGNEAPMVYVAHCQDCAHGYELSLTRNVLFTAITRSRGWVRLHGYGAGMAIIKEEVDAVEANDFTLRFKVPTAAERARMRSIHRDLSASEKGRVKKAERSLKELVDAVESGELSPENLPLPLLQKLQELFKGPLGEADDAS